MGADYRVTLTQIFMGQRIQNVMNFQDTVGTMTESTVADEMVAGWITLVKPIQNNVLVYNSIQVQNLGTPTVAPYVRAVSIAGTTTGWSATMPFICLVLKLGTVHAGRTGRGRVYLAGVNHGAIGTDGLWLSASLTGAFNPVAAALLARYKLTGSGPMTMLVTAKDYSAPDVHFVESLSCRATPGLQRRRCIGVGA